MTDKEDIEALKRKLLDRGPGPLFTPKPEEIHAHELLRQRVEGSIITRAADDTEDASLEAATAAAATLDETAVH